MQTTVQDLGRPGFARYGVPTSGAMDSLSFRLGALLLDNPPDAAALEIALVGPELEALAEIVCTYVGADMGMRVNGARVEPGVVFALRPGDVLEMGAARYGARGYLCVAGGIHVPSILGSCSTSVAAGLGGFEGRPLLGSDVLRVGRPYSSAEELLRRVLKPEWRASYGSSWVLRLVEGSQAAELRDALGVLCASEWKVSDRSNRIGVRLDGPDLPPPTEGFETEGAPLGGVQLPTDGEPILLLADHQVTAGYPIPAAIATVDVPLAGRLRPGDTVRFQRVTEAAAIALLREREERLRAGVFEHLSEPVTGGLPELLETLERSRITEFRLTGPGVSLRWRRRAARGRTTGKTDRGG